jgi:Neuraminidase (sialidase)
MNLRRFSPSRWQEDDTNGRIVYYWNEGSLLTLLRDQDVLRLDRARWYEGEAFGDNEAASRIAQILRSSSGESWLAHSGRQYLRWVSTVEEPWRSPAVAEASLELSDRKWGDIERAGIQFTDRFNDGVHVRTWVNAVREGAAR